MLFNYLKKGINYMKTLLLAISAILVSGSALATPSTATLVNANGSVMVNQGKQFVSAKEGLLLSLGDRVMVMEGGNAVVKYADGCIQTLTSGSLAVIAQQSACVLGANTVAKISPVSAQAVGDKERDCDDDGIPDSKDSDLDGDDVLNAGDNYASCKGDELLTNNTGIWIVAGLAAAGAVVLISDGDDATISP